MYTDGADTMPEENVDPLHSTWVPSRLLCIPAMHSSVLLVLWITSLAPGRFVVLPRRTTTSAPFVGWSIQITKTRLPFSLGTQVNVAVLPSSTVVFDGLCLKVIANRSGVSVKQIGT